MSILKSISFLLLTSLLVFSCGKKDKQDKDKSNELDMASLLTEEMIRTTFELHDSVSVEQDLGSSMAKNYIEYKWEIRSSKEVLYYYSATFNFSNGMPLSQSELNAMWDSQNENVYKDKDMEEVPEVGNKASWSTLGGGQLRVVANKYMFYISLSGGKIQAIPGETEIEDVWSKKYRMEKGVSLANQIIDKLQ